MEIGSSADFQKSPKILYSRYKRIGFSRIRLKPILRITLNRRKRALGACWSNIADACATQIAKLIVNHFHVAW